MGTPTPNKGYTLPTVNGDLNIWGTELNTSLSIIDLNMGGNAAVNVAGNTDVTPNASQAQNLVQTLSGVLTGNIGYLLPAAGGFYIIQNDATGAFNITVKTVAMGSVGVVAPQGVATLVYSDGTDVMLVSSASTTTVVPWIAAGGTVNAITGTYSPAIDTLIDGLILGFRATGANTTTAPTFSPNGLTAHPITQYGGAALVPGSIPAAAWEGLIRYNLANTRWELLNPFPAGNAYWAAAGGTADAITLTISPAISALYDGLLVAGRMTGANTITNPTLNINGLGAGTIFKNGGSALAVGDTGGANYECLFRYKLATTRWELLNPKGFVDPGTLVKTDAVSNFTKQQYFGTATLTDGATINWDCDNQVAKVTLGGNRTMAAPTNMKNGATYILRVYQDGTGSRTITWNAVFRWPGGTAPTLTTTAGKMDIITFTSDGTNMYGVIGGQNYTVT